LAQRNRKRGRRGPAKASPAKKPAPAATATEQIPPKRPGQWYVPPSGEELSRTQRRDAEARANLKPLAPGERPGIIKVSAVLAALLCLSNLIAWLTGDKINGKHPAASGILIFSAVMGACAVGLWRMWYGAVLGFMALLAIIGTLFSLYLVEASNLLGYIVAPIIIVGAGYLFFKLVRVLSRIQMPQRPGS
jgi:hypothetical protein